MTILLANFKHLYQRWTAVLFLLVVGGSCFAALLSFIENERGGALPYAALAVYGLSTFIATFPLEVLTKPFSYCLPRHRTVPARFLFVLGPVLSLLFTLPMFYTEDLFIAGLSRFLTAFLFLTICYWLGVGIVFRFRSWGTAFCIFPLALLNLEHVPSVAVEPFVLSHPWGVLFVAVMGYFFAYRLLWNDHLARRYCGWFSLGLFDHWNRYKVARFRQLQQAAKEEQTPDERALPWEAVFLECIAMSPVDSLRRHVVSCLYRFYSGIFFHRQDWLRFLFCLPFVLCLFGYIDSAANIVFFLPVMLVSDMSLHIQIPHLIAGGRRERFYSGLALGLVMTLCFVLGCCLCTVFSLAVAPIMPEITYKGQVGIFYPLKTELNLVPLLLILLTLTCNLIIRKQGLWSRVLPIVVFMLAFMAAGWGEDTIVMLRGENVIGRGCAFLWSFVFVTLCAWAVFTAVLFFTCTRRCLGG